MSSLRLYNTLTREKEVLDLERTVNLYTCGPTVYDHAHIGNLRSYIFADVLRRTLILNGHKVKWVMNITDVDDKTIKRTIDEFGPKATPKQLREYTERYTKAFMEDLKKLNIPIDEPDITFIKVSDKIEEIKKFMKELMDRGFAYKTEDGVYFSIKKYQEKFGDYGALVGENFLKGKKTGTRVKIDEYEKENISDFALWKGHTASDGEIFWPDAELGNGRPGWHIECSVINHEAFGGKTTDIHTGGVDLIFPHHTNEIAQSQALLGKNKFVKYWAHNEHLLINGEKMAKSKKNIFTLEKEVSDTGSVFRYLTLQVHYQAKMNFTTESLRGAYSVINNLRRAIFPYNDNVSIIEEYDKEFREALNDNLNTAKAIAVINNLINERKIPPPTRAKNVFRFLDLLGLLIEPPKTEMPANVQKLINEREKYRASKQFIQSDRLRKEINDLGYELEDTKEGPKVWPLKNPN